MAQARVPAACGARGLLLRLLGWVVWAASPTVVAARRRLPLLSPSSRSGRALLRPVHSGLTSLDHAPLILRQPGWRSTCRRGAPQDRRARGPGEASGPAAPAARGAGSLPVARGVRLLLGHRDQDPTGRVTSRFFFNLLAGRPAGAAQLHRWLVTSERPRAGSIARPVLHARKLLAYTASCTARSTSTSATTSKDLPFLTDRDPYSCSSAAPPGGRGGPWDFSSTRPACCSARRRPDLRPRPNRRPWAAGPRSGGRAAHLPVRRRRPRVRCHLSPPGAGRFARRSRRGRGQDDAAGAQRLAVLLLRDLLGRAT
jgi:hypothetical protein